MSKHTIFRLSLENEQAGRPNPSLETKFSGANEDSEVYVFPVTRRVIDSLTLLTPKVLCYVFFPFTLDVPAGCEDIALDSINIASSIPFVFLFVSFTFFFFVRGFVLIISSSCFWCVFNFILFCLVNMFFSYYFYYFIPSPPSPPLFGVKWF